MNGWIAIAQASTKAPDNADVVVSCVIVGLILLVSVSMSYGAIRKWWLRRQSTRAMRYPSVNHQQLAMGGYQAPIQQSPRVIKPASTPRSAPVATYQAPATEADKPIKAEEISVRDRTIQAVANLPLLVYYEMPDGLNIPFMFDGIKWHYLTIKPDECTVVCGERRKGKGNLLQLIILSALQAGPERLEVWVVDQKTGLDYGFCSKIGHAKLYADGPGADGGMAHGYINAIREMRRREKILASSGDRNIQEYNARHTIPMPYLLIVCDEVADLPRKFDEELIEDLPQNVLDLLRDGPAGALENLARLSGAAGIVFYAVTQRPTRDVLGGQVQSNTPNRVSLALANGKDTAIALSLGPGDKPHYDPSVIKEPGIAVYRHGSMDYIGRIPEITTAIRDFIVSELQRRYGRGERLILDTAPRMHADVIPYQFDDEDASDDGVNVESVDNFLSGMRSGIEKNVVDLDNPTLNTGNTTNTDTGNTSVKVPGIGVIPDTRVKAIRKALESNLSSNDIAAMMVMDRNKALKVVAHIKSLVESEA